MKRFIAIITIIIVIINTSIISFADRPEILSEAALIMDAETGEVLYEKNMDKTLYPASTTKILTAILAIENSSLDDKVVIDREATLGIDGSHIALEPGEVISMYDLLNALLIESANDAGKAIAIHISGSVEEFTKLMNEKAKELGAENSNFVNPHGLPDDEHVTTAYDLAVIAQYAMKNEIFADIVINYLYTIDPTNKKSEPRYLKSSNKLLYSSQKIYVNGKYVPMKYFGAIGVKTGYTMKAQNCLVSASTRNNQTLIAVVLKANGRNVYVDTHNLFNYAFENYELKSLGHENEYIGNIDVEEGDQPYVAAVVENEVKKVLPKNSRKNIIRKINVPQNIQPPVKEGQVLGNIEYNFKGENIGTANIISTMTVNKKPLPPYLDINSSSFILRKWWTWSIILLLGLLVFFRLKRFKKSRRRSSMFS